jgi:hypothetical protein
LAIMSSDRHVFSEMDARTHEVLWNFMFRTESRVDPDSIAGRSPATDSRTATTETPPQNPVDTALQGPLPPVPPPTPHRDR